MIKKRAIPENTGMQWISSHEKIDARVTTRKANGDAVD